MWWDFISELRPQTDLLFVPQIIYECGEPQRNDIEEGKPNNSEKNQSQCHFVHHNCWPSGHTVWGAGLDSLDTETVVLNPT
jgi:hypothetical protein